MPKRIIQRFTPDHQKVREHKQLQLFGSALRNPNLWHLNRRSVSKAFAIGLFWAMIPIPFQMIFAAFIAIYIRANLPISVALVWISNPITMPPLYYFTYLVGTWIVGRSPQTLEFEWSFEWISNKLSEIWLPLYLGSTLCGIVLALLGFFLMRAYWRWHVLHHWRIRQARRTESSADSTAP